MFVRLQHITFYDIHYLTVLELLSLLSPKEKCSLSTSKPCYTPQTKKLIQETHLVFEQIDILLSRIEYLYNSKPSSIPKTDPLKVLSQYFKLEDVRNSLCPLGGRSDIKFELDYDALTEEKKLLFIKLSDHCGMDEQSKYLSNYQTVPKSAYDKLHSHRLTLDVYTAGKILSLPSCFAVVDMSSVIKYQRTQFVANWLSEFLSSHNRNLEVVYKAITKKVLEMSNNEYTVNAIPKGALVDLTLYYTDHQKTLFDLQYHYLLDQSLFITTTPL